MIIEIYSIAVVVFLFYLAVDLFIVSENKDPGE